MIETAPSFSVYCDKDATPIHEEDKEATSETITDPPEETGTTNLVRSATIGDKIGDAAGVNDTGSGTSGDFCFKEPNTMDSITEEAVVQPSSPELYLATGLGLGGDGDLDYEPKGGVSEESYKKLVDDHPNHPLILKNYGVLLESKGDLHGAEDYYFRAINVSPGDGELLARYAQLVWRLHHDQEKASIYYERAVEAAPNDCDVLGANASFLWEIDGQSSENTDSAEISANPSSANLVKGLGTGIAGLGFTDADGDGSVATAPDEEANPQEFYSKMLEQNPSDSLLLKNYARFLYQSKGDVRSAEKYFLHAIEAADPNDGEILSEYAKFVWEIHHDHGKALHYFERAIEAAPEDSNVLGAYARFLWVLEE